MTDESLPPVLLSVVRDRGDRLSLPERRPQASNFRQSRLSLVAEAVNDRLLREATAELPPSFAARRFLQLLAEVQARALLGDLQGTSEALASASHLVSFAFRGRDRLCPDVVDLVLHDIKQLLKPASHSG